LGRIISIGGSGRQSGNISGLRNAAIAHLPRRFPTSLGPHGITVFASWDHQAHRPNYAERPGAKA
jgi:hypothetical protein